MPLRPTYSLAHADTVAGFAAESYDIGAIQRCALLSRGFNDVYELESNRGDRFVLRIGNRAARGAPNLDYETAFLTHLDRSGVPVAASLPTRDGKLWTVIHLAEGARTVALFHFLEGRFARRGSTPDAYAQGRTLAMVHQTGRTYDGAASRYRLDRDHLIQRPLGLICDLPTLETPDRAYLQAFAARLTQSLDDVRDRLAWGHCHGDCHGLNARITDIGPLDRKAAFFDFDDGGPGWLAYDLAVYLWNKVLNPDTLDLWPPFVDGYKSTLALAQADLDATLLFVPIRHIWFLGERASRAAEWGLDTLSTLWLRQQVEALRNWEQQYLEARLC